MHITDPIADMLTRIRNANNAKHDTVDVPASNMKKSIAQIHSGRHPRYSEVQPRQGEGHHWSSPRFQARPACLCRC